VKSLIRSVNALIRKLLLTGAGIIGVTFIISPAVTAAEPELGGMLILKHRVAVMSLSELSKDKEKAALLLKTPDPLTYFSNEGVVMELDDWASVVDLTKGELSKSDYIRVVEIPRTLSKKEIDSESNDHPESIVLVSYGITEKRKTMFIRLLEVSSGQTVFSTETEGHEMRIAVQNGLSKLENWLLTQAWRCRVIGDRESEAIINRGRLDGLRKGIKLIGYSIRGVPRENKESDEAILLKYGTLVGTYIVTEVRNNFAKVKAAEGKGTLREGDILEMPEVRFIDPAVKTRGNRLWDKIYEK